MDENAVPEDVDLFALLQPYVAVNAAALIPPALDAGGGIRIYSDHIVLAEKDKGRNVKLKGGIAAEIPPGQAAVYIHLGMGGHALKIQRDSAALLGRIQEEMLPIPGVMIMKMAVGPAVSLLGSLGDDVIVGEGHSLPGEALPVIPGGGPPFTAFGFGFQVSYNVVGFGI